MTNADVWNARYAKVVARAWTDEDFKTRLLCDPTSTLADMGIRVPVGVKVNVVENTPGIVNLVLPGVPFDCDLSDFDLEKLAGMETPTWACCTHDCLAIPDSGED